MGATYSYWDTDPEQPCYGIDKDILILAARLPAGVQDMFLDFSGAPASRFANFTREYLITLNQDDFAECAKRFIEADMRACRVSIDDAEKYMPALPEMKTLLAGRSLEIYDIFIEISQSKPEESRWAQCNNTLVKMRDIHVLYCTIAEKIIEASQAYTFGKL